MNSVLRFFTVAVISTTVALVPAMSCAQETKPRPVVIRDYGNTRPSGIPDIEELRKLAYQMRVPVSELIQFSPYSFPIASEKLKVGNLSAPIKHDRSSLTPFFIIGADPHSMEWLARNKEYLIDQKILRGLITNIPDGQTFKHFHEAAAPLQLHPMNVDELGNLFGVRVYPIVITRTEIVQ